MVSRVELIRKCLEGVIEACKTETNRMMVEVVGIETLSRGVGSLADLAAKWFFSLRNKNLLGSFENRCTTNVRKA